MTTTDTIAVTRESQDWAVAAHLSAFVGLFGIPSLLGPLVVWLVRRDDAYVESQARDALNFNLSFLLYGLVSALAVIVLVGLVALPIVAITWFVLVIVASVAASRGEAYRYPFTIEFVRG
ncbi:MAG: DUF4870 domain-containing protein [Acidimicrobiia bacterium]